MTTRTNETKTAGSAREDNNRKKLRGTKSETQRYKGGVKSKKERNGNKQEKVQTQRNARVENLEGNNEKKLKKHGRKMTTMMQS